MYNVLRIISCIISAMFVVACPFVFVYAGNTWGICTILAAIIFAALMFLFRYLQRGREEEEERRSRLSAYGTSAESDVKDGDNTSPDK